MAMALDALPTLTLHDRRANPEAFAKAMGESYAQFGFAVVRDHGLDQGMIDRALTSTKAFFALPEDVKRRYHVQGGGGQRGYVPFGTEAAKGADKVDLKEFWHVGRELPAGHRYRAEMPENLWPAEIESFERDVYALYAALDKLGLELLGSIATFLKLPENFFEAPVKDGNSILRLLHYPPTPPNPEGIRAEAHEDINVITLLLGAGRSWPAIADARRPMARRRPARRRDCREHWRHAATPHQSFAAVHIAPRRQSQRRGAHTCRVIRSRSSYISRRII